ncbi:SgcJ/EcaC family oxidoreductase [Novosphingobium sp. B 225]|uniref:SgcJ/EcaC family oxidoreductase n=1 Tax=Novosphingobium sp. B 225 TaxID=1961849 RepID=UPI000B4BA317|nr:SgcJ/EcaC family oxidoreductase [Novosphingobium sp. B 225]
MKYRITAACAALAVMASVAPALAGTAKGKAQCQMLSAAKLDDHFARFNAAWATKNPVTVTALFDDDAVLLATLANAPRTDHAGVRDYFVKFLKGSPVGRIDTSTIKSGCNWAMRSGTWTVSLTDAATGAKSDVKARYSFLYQFEDGQWKIEHLHSSVMPEKVGA